MTETLVRVVYKARGVDRPNQSKRYVRSGGGHTYDIGQAAVFFKDAKMWNSRWKRYGYEQIPVVVIPVSEEEYHD